MEPSQASCAHGCRQAGWGWGTQSRLVLLHAESFPSQQQLLVTTHQEDPLLSALGFFYLVISTTEDLEMMLSWFLRGSGFGNMINEIEYNLLLSFFQSICGC